MCHYKYKKDERKKGAKKLHCYTRKYLFNSKEVSKRGSNKKDLRYTENSNKTNVQTAHEA